MAIPRELRWPILHVRGSDPGEQTNQTRGTASMPRYDAAEICEVTFSFGLRHCPTFASTPGEVSDRLPS